MTPKERASGFSKEAHPISGSALPALMRLERHLFKADEGPGVGWGEAVPSRLRTYPCHEESGQWLEQTEAQEKAGRLSVCLELWLGFRRE